MIDWPPEVLVADEWNAPVAVSVEEAAVLKLCKKQKLWSFLRMHRHEILDEGIRRRLAEMYATDSKGGRPPVAPERLLLATLLQAGFGVADHEVPTLTAVDRRWQMILDCVGANEPLFSQGTVFRFRERARANGLMALVLDRTVELARTSKGFSDKSLRAIFDSSPLVGAGRVEDTFNLLGHAIAQLLEVAAAEGGVNAAELAKELDVSVFCASSVKAVLDVDWREPSARATALRALLEQFERLRYWLEKTFERRHLEQPPLSEHIQIVERIIEQDTEPEPEGPRDGSRRIREGVTADRLTSLSDHDQRHGRKSKTKTFNGYKRHVATDADIHGLVCAVRVLPANKREHDGAGPLLKSIEDRGYDLRELHIDRGYITAPEVVAKRACGVAVISKAPNPTRSKRFAKHAFDIDFENETVTCPAGIVVPLKLGKTVGFPRARCTPCELRDRCTTNRQRQLNIHPQEQWYREMNAALATKEGRARRRERVAVEHALARIGAIEGKRARFRGLAKNQFALERTAVVNNCLVLNAIRSRAA